MILIKRKKMNKVINLAMITALGLSFTACSYRDNSGISVPENINASTLSVVITEDSFNDKNCKTLEQIDISVKKLTAFHKDPTKDQANYLLSEKAKAINANVVRNVKYSSGIGLMTWGYIDAQGDASKCELK